MTTNHFISDYNYNRNYSYVTPNNTTGQITNRMSNGPYNIIEKDFGDHTVIDYIPSSYGNDYDLSELDEKSFYEEQPRSYSPVIVKQQRYYQSSDEDDDDDDEYILSPRRNMYISPRRSQPRKIIYYEPLPPPPPPPKIEYIYEEDYRPRNEEFLEYIVRDRVPRKRYVEEIESIRPNVYIENLPPIIRSPRPLPTTRSVKSFQSNEFPPVVRRSKMNQKTPRQTPRKILSQNQNPQKYISLKDVLAENRARRGSRIPKPRREVDVEELHDLPTYNKNFIKNDFIVHK